MDTSSPPTAPRPTDPPRVRASEPADLLSYIDHSLGYRPRSSCVGLTRRGSTIGAMVRVDLPAAVQAGQVDPGLYAAAVARHLAQDTQATDCLILLYKDRVHPEAEDRTPEEPITRADRALTEALDRALRGAQIPLREAWMVDLGRLWHLDCPEPEHCPPHGGSVARSEVSAVNATFILEGSVVEPGPDEAARTPQPADRPSLALQAALQRVETLRADAAQAASWMERWELVLSGADTSLAGWTRAETADLIAGLSHAGLRDVVVASAAFSLRRAVSGAEHLGCLPPGTSALVGAPVTEANAVLYVSVLLADTVRGPDWARMDRLHEVCRRLIPHSAGATASALQCLVAWVEWCRGRGTRAGIVVDQCRARDPHYGLADLLQTLLDGGSIAGWAAREDVAWRRG